MVRCILADTTVPVRIRPRMETRPVNGHFLSVASCKRVPKIYNLTLHGLSRAGDPDSLATAHPLMNSTYRCTGPQWQSLGS